MSWNSLTVAELREVLARHKLPSSGSQLKRKDDLVALCKRELTPHDLQIALARPDPKSGGAGSPASPELRRKSSFQKMLPLDSLGASQAARACAIHNSTERRPSRGAAARAGSRIRTAGRFSLPTSDDGIQTPKSRRSIAATPAPSPATVWPTVDPSGQPIRWQIRTPKPVDTPAAQRHPQSTDGKSSQRHSTKSVFSSSKRAFLFLVALGVCLVAYYLARNYSAVFIMGPKFCGSDVTDECTPCPANASCSGGRMECQKPQFTKQWRRGVPICVKDNSLYREGYKLFSSVAEYLAQQRGLLACGLPTYSDAMPLTIDGLLVPGLAECHLTQIILLQLHPGASQPALQLLVEELLLLREDQERFGVGVAEIADELLKGCAANNNWERRKKVFYSQRETKPLSCVTRETALKFAPKLALASFAILAIRAVSARRRVRKESLKAIRQIIGDGTVVEAVRSMATAQVYHAARGVRASEILALLAHRKKDDDEGYKQYEWLARYHTEQSIERLCNELVRSDASICRGLEARDPRPFFFSSRTAELASSN